jgi:hypothetical protein
MIKRFAFIRRSLARVRPSSPKEHAESNGNTTGNNSNSSNGNSSRDDDGNTNAAHKEDQHGRASVSYHFAFIRRSLARVRPSSPKEHAESNGNSSNN